KLDNNTFKSLSFMLVGEPSLLCFTDSKDLVTPRIEYFPICVERIDSKAYEFAQITLARAGGQSDLEQRVQWLFNKPRLRLLDSEEELTGGGLKPQTYTLLWWPGNCRCRRAGQLDAPRYRMLRRYNTAKPLKRPGQGDKVRDFDFFGPQFRINI